MVLLMGDQVIRIVLGRFAGQHITKRYLSLINIVDPHFFNLEKEKALEEKEERKFSKLEDHSYGSSNPDFKRPQYSLAIAHTLAVASKLVYEDVTVVKYELALAGYDVEHSFKAMGYKNVCAYVVEKDNDVILVFRGYTNPLNIQNYVTNIDAGLTKVESAKGDYMGRVHKGFWDAMGTTIEPPDKALETSTSSGSIIKIDLSHASLLKSVSTAVIGILRVMKALTFNVFTNVIDPIDSSWAGHNALIVRHQSMYSQAEKFILDIFSKKDIVSDRTKEKRLLITGHSLGGALATVFLAKMIQKDSPLLRNFAGLYTYGQPNIGDRHFSRSFNIIPRIPPWYSPPPGTLVFLDSTYKISIYPPNQITQEPVRVRKISFLHLSGLLNKNIICRLKTETPLRVVFRILLPFILNDHFPSDYCRALLSGNVEWIIVGEKEGGYVNEEEEQQFSDEDLQQKHLQKHGPSKLATTMK
ncbi:Alpha/Beta hydrolase protein [Mycotypha africana]|uniref:Alpha/Beta hydrolase protein n=1 Tax=Mycotypha africana TaxID=64632 RepID=UPI0023016F69|nr:Alpha/Beta hydrolase protein [Mycotypha africana]KAI8969099.1 Alpha/Beta hydrolase protein [Mycotypha africana]